MDEKERDKAICKALSLDYLGENFHRFRDEAGNFLDGFWVEYLWLATIQRHVGIRIYSFSTVTIGIAKCTRRKPTPQLKAEITVFYKGIVLVDKYPDPFVGADPVRSIEFPDFYDPVIEHLQHVNLAPQIEEIIPDDETVDLNLRIFVPYSAGNLKFHGGGIQDPATERLWDNLHEIGEGIAKAYDDQELNDFFARGKRFW
jgi:hypothetical protein